MARPSTGGKRGAPVIERRDPPPIKSTQGGRWLETLTPLLKQRSAWYMVKEFDNPTQANDAQSNLTQRRVRIPEPDWDWSFAARGCELFAICHGPKRPSRKRTRS
jgi:hypothetical protein